MWICRYVIRRLGLVLLAGMITLLALAIDWQLTRRHADLAGRTPHGAGVAHAPLDGARRVP